MFQVVSEVQHGVLAFEEHFLWWKRKEINDKQSTLGVIPEARWRQGRKSCVVLRGCVVG